MSSKLLGNLLKISIIFIAVCGLAACLFAAPMFGRDIVDAYPEFSSWLVPWQIFVWIVALPCFAVLVLGWLVSDAVIGETVFTHKTAKQIKFSSVFLLADAVIFFVGNIVMLLLNMNHPGVLLLSIAVDIFVVALAIILAILSRYLSKAAVLQEESDGTL